jgi:hypothetical protein
MSVTIEAAVLAKLVPNDAVSTAKVIWRRMIWGGMFVSEENE